jgi:hypothetical protein
LFELFGFFLEAFEGDRALREFLLLWGALAAFVWGLLQG